MATSGRGLICLAMTAERLDELELAPMAPDNARWAAKKRGVSKPSSRSKLSHFLCQYGLPPSEGADFAPDSDEVTALWSPHTFPPLQRSPGR